MRSSSDGSWCSASEISVSSASVTPRQADSTTALRVAGSPSTIRATRSMQAASATLDPPNLWTFQASTVNWLPCGRPRRHADQSRLGDGSSRVRADGRLLVLTKSLYLLAARQANYGAMNGFDSPALHAAILAAGAATRFGSPKQLVRLAGTPVLHQAIANASLVAGHSVTVVLGAHAREIGPALRQSAVSDGREPRLGGRARELDPGRSAFGARRARKD